MCPDTLSGRLLQERLNQDSILVEIVRPSIWQLRGSLGTRGLNTPVPFVGHRFFFAVELRFEMGMLVLFRLSKRFCY